MIQFMASKVDSWGEQADSHPKVMIDDSQYD
jgi:hypothetical protein